MDLQEIRNYLNENKDNSDAQALINEFKTVSDEDVRSHLETDSGKRILQPILDRYHNKSLQTWKDNNLKTIVDEEVAKRNPQETEEQKRIRKLEEELENRDKSAKRQELETKALKLAQEKSLPVDLVNFFIGDDEEATSANLDTFKSKLDETVKTQVEQRFKDNGRNVQDGSGGTVPKLQSYKEMAEEVNIRNK